MPATPPADVSRTALVRRARRIDRELAATYPDARCELDFDDPFQLLVVTVLSAQTTDKRVNAVRPTLFAAYPDPVSMAGAPREDLERIVGPLGFFRAKTESLLTLSQALVERYEWERELPVHEFMGMRSSRKVVREPVGVVGAIYPTLRAVRLTPIAALRHE